MAGIDYHTMRGIVTMQFFALPNARRSPQSTTPRTDSASPQAPSVKPPNDIYVPLERVPLIFIQPSLPGKMGTFLPAIHPGAKKMDPRGSSPRVTGEGGVNFIETDSNTDRELQYGP